MNSTQIFGIAIIIILIISGLPFLMIWSLNQLFNIGIQYTFLNWLAMVFLGVFIRIIVVNTSKTTKNIFNTNNGVNNGL